MKAAKAAVVILVARITPGLSYLIPLFLLFQWIGGAGDDQAVEEVGREAVRLDHVEVVLPGEPLGDQDA
jgi:hypothetical protein